MKRNGTFACQVEFVIIFIQFHLLIDWLICRQLKCVAHGTLSTLWLLCSQFFFWSFLCWATTTLWWQSTHTYCHSFLRQHSYIWNSVYRFLLIKMANGNKIHRTILQLNEPQNNEHWIISGQLLLFSSGTAVIFAVDLLWQRQPTTTTTTTNLVEMWSCVMDFLFIYPFPCWYRCVTIHLVFIYCLHTWCYMLCWNMILSEN